MTTMLLKTEESTGQRRTRIETPRGGETAGEGRGTGDTTEERANVATRRGQLQLHGEGEQRS